MITEEDIRKTYHILVGSTYLLATKNCLYGLKWEPEQYFEADYRCPYCGCAPSGTRDSVYEGPGGWMYKTYSCGVRSAIRTAYVGLTGGVTVCGDVLMAVTKQTDECRITSAMTATQNEDVI